MMNLSDSYKTFRASTLLKFDSRSSRPALGKRKEFHEPFKRRFLNSHKSQRA